MATTTTPVAKRTRAIWCPGMVEEIRRATMAMPANKVDEAMALSAALEADAD
jgi:hypothetical protein